jgi:tetratricopeptide (TPR) repeat protein
MSDAHQIRDHRHAPRSPKLPLWCALVATAFVAFAPIMRPAAAQTPAPSQDSVFNAAMNRAYDALRAGDSTAAISGFREALRRDPSSATAHFQLGYILLALGRRDDAATEFEEGLARDFSQDAPRRQLGYLYADLGRHRDALRVFTGLRDDNKAIPRDYVAIGNLSSMLRDRAGAETAFRAAIASGDTSVVPDARRGLDGVSQTGVGAGWFGELYAAPFYQDRFDNTVGLGFARAGVRGGGWWRPSAYASLRVTRDSRSTGGRQPVLFNDNTLIPAFGLRVSPGGVGLALYAEAGAAYDLVGEPSEWQRDLRAGANYAVAHEQSLRNGLAPLLVTEFSADASFYERFDRNVIAYAQLRESLRLYKGNHVAFDLFGRAWGATDSRGDFFNRVVEGGGGAALHLSVGTVRTSVYVDVLRGRYLQQPPSSSLLTRTYDDWRVTVATGLFRFLPFDRP